MTAKPRAARKVALACSVLLLVGVAMQAWPAVSPAAGIITVKWIMPTSLTTGGALPAGQLVATNVRCRKISAATFDAPVRVALPALSTTVALDDTEQRSCAVTALNKIVVDAATTVEMESSLSAEVLFTPTPTPLSNPPAKPTVTVTGCLITVPGAAPIPCTLTVVP